ncbi:UbiA family prenyltransferase [Pseudorhodoplanes sinuspersici]|nr:UbiA family prenyltransferase [Pseudorhodoplanes sinuspersici]RKE72934.1 4-hydroxybenzoate polyprenyltransferase [Pseudorhodoplanes sinuspersici]
MRALNFATAEQKALQADLPPLVLDVDDALLRTDLLHETAVAYVKANPLRVVQLGLWLLQGKAVLKRKLSERVPLDVDHLPVNEDLVAFAAAEHAKGRKVGLATAADLLLAHRLARRFDFISFVIASDGVTNLKGGHKARQLAARFPSGFAYAGDSQADLKVWRQSRSIVLAGASPSVAQAARNLGKPVEAEFPRPSLGLKGFAKALRIHQWAKNALVFVPLILSGMADQPMALLQGVVAFAAMSLMASGTYLLNDLFDLADDRKHWTKRNRPLASGALRIKHGIPIAAALIATSFVAAAWLGLASLAVLTLYMATTLAYSFYLKRQPIVDAFTLAFLFTLRLGIGITAVAAPPSPWLLVFSMFLFTSLSFAKRQTEIQRSVAKGQTTISGRGYLGADSGLVLAMGMATGMSAIVIMVLYIMNDVYPAGFYHMPQLLWVLPAALFMWISRIWLLCHRGELNDDPVAFAVRDKISIALGGIMGAAFLAGWLV